MTWPTKPSPGLNEVGYVDNITPAAGMLLPAFAGSLLIDAGPVMGTAIWVYLMSVLHTTEFHKQAHLKKPNRFFAVLQKMGISLGHADHIEHHKPPFDTNFAVFNGWSNGLAQRLDLWNRMDRIYWKIYRQMPHNWQQDPRSIPDAVVEELKADLSLIPEELWHYAATYPYRVPEELRALMAEARGEHDLKKIQGVNESR